MKYKFNLFEKVLFKSFWMITFEARELQKTHPVFVDLNETRIPQNFTQIGGHYGGQKPENPYFPPIWIYGFYQKFINQSFSQMDLHEIWQTEDALSNDTMIIQI